VSVVTIVFLQIVGGALVVTVAGALVQRWIREG
jgi:hypothetical protein